MAIERNVPQDTRKYEPKFIWIFTMRQFFCAVPACAIGLIVLLGLGGALSLSARIFITMICAIPFGVFGWVKPYNMPFEKYAMSVLRSHVISPAIRRYKTARIIEAPKSNVKKKKKKKKYKNVESKYIPHR